MTIQDRIPSEFYKLFRTKNRDVYMTFLVVLYKENSDAYNSIGLTLEECAQILAEQIAKSQIAWEDEPEEDLGEPDGETRGLNELDDMADSSLSVSAAGALPVSPTGILTRFINWGWIRRDFDDALNSYVISFPEYSQLYLELFEKLQSEDDSQERESILAIYSTLFTYHSDREKNHDILKNALRTSKSLGQLLSNMQDGMRLYFDELSSRKNFIGIQEVLVRELNNNDSKKYAILTTTDSFYRYKEAVKELISQILSDNDRRYQRLLVEEAELDTTNSAARIRLNHRLQFCEDATQLVLQVEREFDLIEKKYNKLIEQKAVFAKRALARIHYILQEGSSDEEYVVRLINLLSRSERADEILEDYSKRIPVSTQFKLFEDASLYSRRDRAETEFVPVVVEQQTEGEEQMENFVPKPLYTRRQLHAFREKNMINGHFVTTEATVSDIEDLEKLMFLWQEATGENHEYAQVELEDEIRGKDGFVFTRLIL